MAKITKLDQMLIAEAYSSQLLEEAAPHMTISEIQNRLPHMTIEEAQIIEELFGKLGQKIGQVASGIGGVGTAAARGAASVGKAAGQAVGQAAGQLGSGVKSAVGQAAQNVGDMYSTAAQSKSSEQAVQNAFKSATDLIDIVKQAQQSGLIKSQGEVTDMTLSDIMDQLETAKQSAATFQQGAAKTGFTGGVGQAFKQGMSSAGGAPAPSAA